MKKLLILVLIALIVALCIFMIVSGVQIGNIEVLGINGMQQKSSKLDGKIQEAAKLAQKDYLQTVGSVEENAKKLEQEKKDYDDMTATTQEGDTQTTGQIEKYEIETLWVKLGNHATSEGAIMKMDVLRGTNGVADSYNLKFTVTGSYISITDFISAIENDSTLGFKIEEFKMVPTGSGSDLEATFVCKDIAIKDVAEITSPANPTGQTDGTTAGATDGTNTTNTNATNTNANNTMNATQNTNVAR